MLILPNIISLIRIALSVGLFAMFHVTKRIDILFVLMFFIAAISDKLDGYLARKLDNVTTLGKLLDPISDKLLAFVVMIILLKLKLLPLWAVSVALLKDAALSNYRFIKFKRGVVVPAIKIGRYKTAYNFFVFGITFLYIQLYGIISTGSEKASFIKYLLLTTIL